MLINPKQLASAKKQASALPALPGVYCYQDQTGHIIYVGKAKNLRKRVSSYFNKQQDYKTTLLINKIHQINYTVTPTEIDALILEDQLINEHQPHYNILLKDESSFRYICISKTNPPHITTTRRPVKNRYCLGPFPFATQQFVNIARDLLGLAKHQQLTTNDWQLYLQAATLRDKKDKNTPALDAELYQKFITGLIKTIKQGDDSLILAYQNHMQQHAQKLEFEQALQYRNKITLLQKITGRTSQIHPQNRLSEHLLVGIDQISEVTLFLFQVKNGLLYLIKTFNFEPADQTEILESFLKQYYKHTPPPSKISIMYEPDFSNSQAVRSIDPSITDYLNTQWASTTTISMLTNHKLWPLALKNIQAKLDLKTNLATQLKNLLKLQTPPTTIDFVDISNLGALFAVGGVVRFVNGKPVKKFWRHYRIKTVTGQDDYAAIFETISRRYQTISLPDVLVVDGGLGQLNAALQALPLSGPTTAIGLAKKEETLIFKDHSTKQLSLLLAADQFIIKGRDTVHHFVVGHTKVLFKKHYKQSWLDNIAGIGPHTKLILLKHFKSITQIQQATLAELTSLIGPHKAHLIKKTGYLR